MISLIQDEEFTVTARTEALPNFCGEIATVIVADRKLCIVRNPFQL